MGSLKKNTLLVVLGFIIAFLVLRLYQGQVRLNSFKNQISKYSLKGQFFNERLTKDSLKLAEQNQVLLSQKDAIKLGVLEIENLKR